MKVSTDIWFIAFLMLKGFKVSSYEVISRGKVECRFELNEEEWKRLKLEFNHSDLVRFKALIEQVKDLGY